VAIQPGTRLGPYEVRAAIGAGGMGEVYKARDTRLDRIVAIKVLPAHLADKPELRERFEREARTIASLNHPHICTLHDVGHQDGSDFLVMEYLEGETLATRLVKGPLPLDQVLRYAVEISDALDKAHRHGITHRDLKPSNVMLTKSGAKLLDFGLAKLKQGAAQAPPRESQAPTLSHNPTVEGTLLGTIQYMAPEQVEGKVDEIDGRTDIFAFGALVYEMATGKRAFEGKTQASLIAKILEHDPPPISSIQPVTPPTLDRLTRICLAKQPDDRWQTMGDIAKQLQWMAEAGTHPNVTPPIVARKKRREMIAWTVAIIAFSAAAAVLYLREAPAAMPETRTEIVTPSTNDLVSFALSPDGRRIVFVATDDGSSKLWVRQLDGTRAQPLVGTEGASYPFWSPDSRSVAFFAEGKLKRTEITGGTPQTLSAAENRGGTWNSEGTILLGSVSGPLFRIPASGGEPAPATKLEKQVAHRFPYFLPDGRRFLFYAQGAPEASGIYLGSLDSAEIKRVATSEAAGVYARNGWLLFLRSGTLLSQQLDLQRGVLTGDPIKIADSVTFDALTAPAMSVSGTGLMAYRAGGFVRHQLIWYDRTGKMLGILGAPDATIMSAPSLSPDGRSAAVYRTVEGNTDIWLLDVARAIRFSFDPSIERYPIWSPDGRRIVFDSTRMGHRDLYIKSSNGAGSEELLLQSDQDKVVSDWSRDGRFLLYHSVDPKTSYDIWVLPLEGNPSTGIKAGKPFVYLKTNADERRAHFSPDGRWVAYRSNESGRYQIYVRPFNGSPSAATSPAGADGQWQVSTAGGIEPRWAPNGKELYYIASDAKLMGVPIAANGEPGAPKALFQTRIYGGGTDMNLGTQYDISADGRFLVNTLFEEATAPITLVQAWNPGVKR
jgi:serine/threonine protein kinase